MPIQLNLVRHNLLNFAVLLACVACTPVSVTHFQSEQRLDQGLDRKLQAERQAMGSSSESNGKPGVSLGVDDARNLTSLQLQTARSALAEDARTDYRAATAPWTGANDLDRISVLNRAALKAWYGGRATDSDLIAEISSAGARLCGRNNNALLAPRDCDLFKVLPNLSSLQEGHDIYLDAQIYLKNPVEAQTDEQDRRATTDLVTAIASLNLASSQLSMKFTELRPDIRRFAESQQKDYWCSAAFAMSELRDGTTSSLRRVGYAVLADEDENPTVEQQQIVNALVADKGFNRVQGTYGSYAKAIDALYPGLIPRKRERPEYLKDAYDHDEACEKG